MNINKKVVTVGTVERERERESYSLFNVEFIKTKKRSNKNLLLKRIGYICNEKEMIGYECNNRSYREIAYHFIR